MSAILIPALFGLLGVIVGGIITTGSSYLLQRRSERIDRERESRNLGIEIKRAARLIDAELVRAQAAARIAIRTKHWAIPDATLKTEAWQKYSSIIAPVLSYPDWSRLIVAVLAVDDLRVDRLPGDIPDSTVAHLVPMLEDIEAGVIALMPFVGDASPPLPSPKHSSGQ